MGGIYGLFTTIFSCVIGIIAGGIVGIVTLLIVSRQPKETNPLNIAAITGCSISLLVFCGMSWYYLDLLYGASPAPKNQPAEGDIIGIWYVDNGSRQMLEEFEYIVQDDLEYKLEIKENGEIIATNIPDRYGQFFSDIGTWTLEKHGNKWRIIVYYENGIYTNYDLYGEDPPYKLYELWGELTALTFERKK